MRVHLCRTCGDILGITEVEKTPLPEGTYAATVHVSTDCGACHKLKIPLQHNSAVENNRELLEKFCGPPIDSTQPEATIEDLKVLFVRASNIIWPDKKNKCRSQSCKNNWHKHPKFTSKDGKAFIKGLYKVESTKELRKPQVGFILTEFGKILTGAAYFDRDENGIPFIVVMSKVNMKEVEKER